MLHKKFTGVAMGFGIASITILASAQQAGEQTRIPNPFNPLAWGNITAAVAAPGAAKPTQGGFNVVNPSGWTTGGTNIFDTSTWSANTSFLPQPLISPFNQAQLAGLMALMNPAFYGQFMNPRFYLQFMNPSNRLPWWNPMSYPAHLNPATYMQWSSSFAYASFLNPMSYFNRMNTPASVHPQ